MKPTVTQTSVEAHDTELREVMPLGRVPTLQAEPPSVEYRAVLTGGEKPLK
jgi:glutathione S-transferase